MAAEQELFINLFYKYIYIFLVLLASQTYQKEASGQESSRPFIRKHVQIEKRKNKKKQNKQTNNMSSLDTHNSSKSTSVWLICCNINKIMSYLKVFNWV